MTEPLPLRQALPAVWREARTAPPQPPREASPEEHWTFLWRSLLAAMLTWQGLALYVLLVVVGTLLLG